MASFAASSALGLGAGAALYNFGYQGAYKEDITVASGAACAVFVVLSVVQKLLASGGTNTPTAPNASESKKKKKKVAKKAESSEDSDSGSEATPKNKADPSAKAKAAPKGKAKEEKKEVKQEPDKKQDKQKANTEQKPTKASGKDAKKGGEVSKETKKGEVAKDAAKDPKKDSKKAEPVKKGDAKKGGASEKKQEPPKSNKKAKKEESDATDSEDEEAFLRLGQKNTVGLMTSKAPPAAVAPQSDDEEESEEEQAPAKELSNSKSAIRRRKQKENKEKAAAAAAAETASSKPKKVVDKDGFETVQVAKRPPKKPAAATTAVAASESKTESKAPAASTYSDTLELESKQMALLIGPKGATLNALSEACGNVKIDTPTRDSGDKKVTISGAEESVRYCKSQIISLTTKGYCTALNPGTTSSNMTLEPIGLATLIGPGGVNIKKIQEAFEVRIQTPASRASGSQQVAISGQKDNVKKAKACIKQLVEHGFSSVTHEGYEVGEVPFPRDQLRHLIGPGGQTIKSIQGDTKTKIKIPEEGAENQNVQVIGPAAGVARAIKQISTLLERKAAKEAARAEAAEYDSDDDGY